MPSNFDDKRLPVLRREVLYPQRQNTGVGVMLVASAAMFFAVSSSAFILRAQMPARSQCVHQSQRAPLVDDSELHAVPVELISETDLATPRAQPAKDSLTTIESCSEPQYRQEPDGTVQVVFDLCDGK